MKSVRNKKAQKDNTYGRDRGLEGGLGGFSLGISRTMGSGSFVIIIDMSSWPRVTASHTALAPDPLNQTVSLKVGRRIGHALQYRFPIFERERIDQLLDNTHINPIVPTACARIEFECKETIWTIGT
jgi:hypothetical protein